MSRPFSDYTGQFFWDFKRMDNVNYNFEVVEILYKAKKKNGGAWLFNKPITLLLIAIIECMLYDFLKRIYQHRQDPFPNIAQRAILAIRGHSETDELKDLIKRVREQSLLNTAIGGNIYDDLDHLRLLRNRIHIQNKFYSLDKDEYKVFTDHELGKTEECFLRVIDSLCNVYPRGNRNPLPMGEFPCPWVS